MEPSANPLDQVPHRFKDENGVFDATTLRILINVFDFPESLHIFFPPRPFCRIHVISPYCLDPSYAFNYHYYIFCFFQEMFFLNMVQN
jgi:hypothetical protein